jgi:hypothetical protein
MPGFNTLPAVGGGGGQANMTFVASVHMPTFNRSWAQGGTAGYYSLYSTNQESGYAYFVGAGTSTGAPLNRLVNVTHAFTRVDIIAPVNDMISLYKAKVKSTTVFNNPFDADGTIGKIAIPSFPSVISSSGNFVLPNNALPLVNVLINGAGGGGGSNHCGGGGAGGSVVKLSAYQAVGTTSVSIGGGGDGSVGGTGGRTYFGNVYALGGGGGGWHSGNNPKSALATSNSGQALDPEAGNGGGAGGHNNASHRYGGIGGTQTAATGLGTTGSPQYIGGFTGGNSSGNDSQQAGGGGGAGSGGNGFDGNDSYAGDGGPAHISDISGTSWAYGAGAPGGRANSNNQSFGNYTGAHNFGHGGRGAGYNTSGRAGGSSGIVVVRYYIP